MARQFSFMEFFAGGGMARLGLGENWKCLLANDFDSQKCAAYRENFGGDDLIEGDIAAIAPTALPKERADLAWASFPCQDLSLAGARGGVASARSGTFFAFWKHIEELAKTDRAPRIIALENVTGLLTSNKGKDFVRLVTLMADAGYLATAVVLDALSFTPQSRPRIFILGFDKRALISFGDKPQQANSFTPSALLSAVRALPANAAKNWRWISPRPANRSNIRLSDIIDWEADQWDTPQQTRHLLSMMSGAQKDRVDAIIKNDARRAGAGFRRTRIENGNTVQRFEARFDGAAGCLRTPAGGSSRQIIITIENRTVRTRLMSPNEAARLMGLPDTYKLPASNTAALKLCGDGVCVPAVQWLAENIIEPALLSSATGRAAA